MFRSIRMTLGLIADTVAGERTRKRQNAGKILGGTMVRGHIDVILELIRQHKPHTILELGPGWSTVHMAEAINELDLKTKIVAVEHDPRWARRLERRLKDRNLNDRVTIVVSPLVDQPTDISLGYPKTLTWYKDHERIASHGPFDFVVVDGPPAFEGTPHRLPVLPRLWNVIQPGAPIILDDAHRPAEIDMVNAWRATYNDELSEPRSEVNGHLAILQRRPAAHPDAHHAPNTTIDVSAQNKTIASSTETSDLQT